MILSFKINPKNEFIPEILTPHNPPSSYGKEMSNRIYLFIVHSLLPSPLKGEGLGMRVLIVALNKLF